jgi:hypothetical protein
MSEQLTIVGFVNLKPNTDLFFSPGPGGLLMMALFWAVGWWMPQKQDTDPV